MQMFYKIDTTITNTNGNTKVAEQCPDGYITFDEMKYGKKEIEPIVNIPTDIVDVKGMRKYNKRNK